MQLRFRHAFERLSSAVSDVCSIGFVVHVFSTFFLIMLLIIAVCVCLPVSALLWLDRILQDRSKKDD